MDEQQKLSEHFHCGYVTIIGEPNVGKSTLMNALLNQKISIVTHKPQTTRHKIIGILSTQEYQLIFLDTPGIITPKYLLQEVMMQLASSAIEDADVIAFMIDATDPKTAAPQANEEAFKRLDGLRKPVYLVINKVDAIKKQDLLPIIDSYARAYSYAEIFPISALKCEGTAGLLQALIRHVPEHPPFYPLDIVSEQSERFFVSEIIREKVFLKCQQEIPYSTTVDVVEFKEREGSSDTTDRTRKWFISADVYVERDSQKGIIIGKKGSMLKEIGRLARKDIEDFLQHPVYLELHVKVRKDWRGDGNWLERLGYR
jgi:GTP-binding protein Era